MLKYARVNTTALDAANYLLDLAQSEGVSLDSITLQKILYYCQCWSLYEGQRLFDDAVEAWTHGPVVPSVWKAFSGSSKIRKADQPRAYELSDSQRDLIFSVWNTLKNKHGLDLSKKTHEDGTAWRKARRDLPATAPSKHELALDDMADEARVMEKKAEKALLDAWDDLARLEK